jgi:pimeloyl-ACP methyl ester carboxylesterase
MSYAAVIVIGFVGGFVHHFDTVHQEVQLANHLRKDYPSEMQVEIFENHLGRQAHREIVRLLDSDHDGRLSSDEKLKARIVLYGHSWGASEAVSMARTLQKEGVPVLLTIQVDSVSKLGTDDRSIPANVAQAVNFYQLDGLLHGQRQIVAADPSHTRILGNFQFNYKTKPVNTDGFPWYARLFMKPHIEIESDPIVWNRVESLIRSEVAASK